MRLSLNNDKDFIEYKIGQNNTIEIFDLAVNSVRRNGIGTQLIKMLIDKFPEHHIFAFMRRSNHRAEKFYVSCGFKGVVLPKFYPDEDAIIMMYKPL